MKVMLKKAYFFEESQMQKLRLYLILQCVREINVYNYDKLDRLTKVVYPDSKTEEFEYDELGNRVKHVKKDGTTVTNTYDDNNRLVESSDNTTYTYDNNGNQTSKTDSSGTTNYIYNKDNKLTRVEHSNGDISTYKYDSEGRRIEKVEDGKKNKVFFSFLKMRAKKTNSRGITPIYPISSP